MGEAKRKQDNALIKYRWRFKFDFEHDSDVWLFGLCLLVGKDEPGIAIVIGKLGFAFIRTRIA